MELLLNRRGDEIRITEKVIKAALDNQRKGKAVMELLLSQRGEEIKRMKEVAKATPGK